jgi:hypothetical protein
VTRRLLILAATAGLLAAPARGQTRRPTVPPAAAYTVTTSAHDLESLRVEGRLAQFVRALQAGRREKAAALLSSRVGPEARRALIEKRWLPAKPGSGEFGAVLFWRDLHIRTMHVQGDVRRLVVGPRKIAFAPGNKKRAPIGVLEVPMRRERGQWWVDLLPPRK